MQIGCCRSTVYARNGFVDAQDVLLRSSYIHEVLLTHGGLFKREMLIHIPN